MVRICTKCGDLFTDEDLAELRKEHESFSMDPFMCPDCYDRFSRMDLEDQFEDLMEEEDGINL